MKSYIKLLDFDQTSLLDFKNKIKEANDTKLEKYLLEYPTVYIVYDQMKAEYSVYVGETNDIVQRTQQHLLNDPNSREDWKYLSESDSSKMFVIGHEYFNKSLTLDLENKLMHYLSSVDGIKHVYNRRNNLQNSYYTSEYLDDIFSAIWQKLRRFNKDLFPLESVIKDSAIFKASPFHKLTTEQLEARTQILTQVQEALLQDETGQLILVSGAAGSGKTVLISSLFYDLSHDILDEDGQVILKDLDNYLLVNHEEQLIVYQQIAERLQLVDSKDKDTISKPTRFINSTMKDKMADVVLIDEAHLLWTQGKQAYRGENQLADILKKAKVVVAVFDINQVLATNQYWEKSQLNKLTQRSTRLIHLKNQMRISSNPAIMKWIRNLVDIGKIGDIPTDLTYDLKIFDDIKEMHQAIKEKSKNKEKGLSRIIATFDWEFVQKRKPETEDYWMVREKDWALPWNLQLKPKDPAIRRKNKLLAWAEQDHTIEEVGSTYTIQGFDLNYAGVIIGPSVKYRNGRIIFDRKGSKNKNATQQRTLSDGRKADFSNQLLKNELNVLLTRGVHGLYIYAVDPELRQALLQADRRNLS